MAAAAQGDVSTAKEFPNPVLPRSDISYPIRVVYCGVCSLPTELCEFSPEPEKCKEWLRQNLPGQLAGASISGDGEDKGADEGEGDGDDKKKRQTRGGKGRPKLPVAEVKTQPGMIKLSISNRGKKKYVTVVTGLGTHGIDLKAAVKFFGQKFACGSSLTGDDEIVIQGDVKDDLMDVIPEKWPQVDEDQIDDIGELKR